jgi:glutathione peroxidase (fragment)
MKKIDFYSLPVKEQDGSISNLSCYKGKVLLIVNTATHCIFTDRYKELELLYKTHVNEGFEILDFPCNQFGGETPENDDEINMFCEKTYQTTFKRFHKIDVKGDQIEPLFEHLIKKKKFQGFYPLDPLSGVLACKCIKEGPGWEEKPDIKWNFTMFLVDRNGKVVRRFEATTPFETIKKQVEQVLDKSLFDNNI